MRLSKNILALFLPASLAACAISPPVSTSSEGAVRLECTVSTPVLDGQAVTGCVVDYATLGPDGKSDLTNMKREGHLFSSTPTLSNVAVGSTNGALAARIQSKGLENAAKIGQCAEGANCGTQIVNLNNNNALGVGGTGVGVGGAASAGSASDSSSAAAANVGSSTQGPVPK